jgi:hypothetical protein
MIVIANHGVSRLANALESKQPKFRLCILTSEIQFYYWQSGSTTTVSAVNALPYRSRVRSHLFSLGIRGTARAYVFAVGVCIFVLPLSLVYDTSSARRYSNEFTVPRARHR